MQGHNRLTVNTTLHITDTCCGVSVAQAMKDSYDPGDMYGAVCIWTVSFNVSSTDIAS